MSLPASYATVDDLGDYWRPLTTAEQDRATVLLGEVADLINALPGAAGFASTATRWVSLAAVKRAMISPGGDGVRQQSEAMDGISVSQTFVNPTGAVYLMRSEIRRLRGKTAPAAFSIAPGNQVHIPHTVWNRQWPRSH